MLIPNIFTTSEERIKMFDTRSWSPISYGHLKKTYCAVPIAALSDARNPHVRSVHASFCAPSALHSNRFITLFSSALIWETNPCRPPNRTRIVQFLNASSSAHPNYGFYAHREHQRNYHIDRPFFFNTFCALQLPILLSNVTTCPTIRLFKIHPSSFRYSAGTINTPLSQLTHIKNI